MSQYDLMPTICPHSFTVAPRPGVPQICQQCAAVCQTAIVDQSVSGNIVDACYPGYYGATNPFTSTPFATAAFAR